MTSQERTLFIFLFGILATLSLLGNIVTCVVVARWRALHKPINYLLLNLCLANLAVAVFSAPRFIFGPTFVHPSGQAGDIFCKLVTAQNIFWVGGVASGFSLSLIAYERFRAVVYPHSVTKRLRGQKLRLTIILSWLYAFILNVPNFIASRITHENSSLVCTHIWPGEEHKQAWAWFLVLISFIGPLTVITCLYTSTVYHLYKKRTRGNLPRMAVYRSRKRITVTLITITVIFALCWAPQGVTYILQAYRSRVHSSLLDEIASLLACVNSATHPFLCALSCQAFRRGFSKIFRFSNKVDSIHSVRTSWRLLSRHLTVQPITTDNFSVTVAVGLIT